MVFSEPDNKTLTVKQGVAERRPCSFPRFWGGLGPGRGGGVHHHAIMSTAKKGAITLSAESRGQLDPPGLTVADQSVRCALVYYRRRLFFGLQVSGLTFSAHPRYPATIKLLL